MVFCFVFFFWFTGICDQRCGGCGVVIGVMVFFFLFISVSPIWVDMDDGGVVWRSWVDMDDGLEEEAGRR